MTGKYGDYTVEKMLRFYGKVKFNRGEKQ